MTARYEGKSPSRLWYAAQYAKVFVTAPLRRATRPEALRAGRNSICSAGLMAGAKLAAPYLLIPFLPTIVMVGGVVAGGFFAVLTYRNLEALKNSGTVSDYIHQKERNWVDRQSRTKLTTYMARLVPRFLIAPARFCFRAAKWLGYGMAAIAVAGAAVSIAYPVAVTTAFGGAVSAIMFAAGAVGVASVGVLSGIFCRKIDKALLEKKSNLPAEKTVKAVVGRARSMKEISRAFQGSANISAEPASSAQASPEPDAAAQARANARRTRRANEA